MFVFSYSCRRGVRTLTPRATSGDRSTWRPSPVSRLRRDAVPTKASLTNPCVAPFCWAAPKIAMVCVVAA
jgi:hypothetical protein